MKKLLLLGAGGSGKSTFFKQLDEIYNEGMSLQQRKVFIGHIHDNVIKCIRFCIDVARQDRIEADETLEESLRFLERTPTDSKLTPKLAKHVKIVWADDTIQKIFTHHTERVFDGRIHPSTKWFMDKIDTISEPEYLPSVDDIMRTRFRTTGIVEKEFVAELKSKKKQRFKMLDVGGQKSERRKWVHCFEDISGILFVASLTSYNEKMWEEDDKNRMEDSVQLFHQICNSRWFRRSSIILFLNKMDLFKKRIKDVPLNVCPLFEDMDENKANDKDICYEMIADIFNSQMKTKKKQVFIHATVAIDSRNVEKIFSSVRMQILNDNLHACGLV